MMLEKPRDATPEEFCQWLKGELERDGDALFGDLPTLILYSGPVELFRQAVEALLGRPVSGNKQRGRDQAKHFATNILDDSPIGKWLLAQDLVGYFDKVCGGDDNLVIKAIFNVWGTVSEEFVRQAGGKAFTSVCGAAPDRMFRLRELPQMLIETGLASVNNVPVALINDFSILGVDEAFRQICKFELLSLHYQAKQETDPGKTRELREKWREQKRFFRQSLNEKNASALQRAPAEAKLLRLRRRSIRSGYDMLEIKEATIAEATAARPMPLASPAPLPTSRPH